ncbi:MAG TPA: transposase [Thermoanaerobaculaceae bacterium]|nr:transposase [Thermoanaerobaculaceae bacterium]
MRDPTCFPERLPRRRAERGLTGVVADSDVLGVARGRLEQLVESMGPSGISRSQLSEMANSLDAAVEDVRRRRLDSGPYRHLWLDPLVVTCRKAAASSTSLWSSPPPSTRMGTGRSWQPMS